MSVLKATIQAVRRLSTGLYGCYKVGGKRFAGKIEFASGVTPVLYKGFLGEVTQDGDKTTVTKVTKKLR